MARDEVDEDVDVGRTADEDVVVAGTVDEPAVDVVDDVSAAVQAASAFASIRTTKKRATRLVSVAMSHHRPAC
jgi:hypothetical protein